MQVDISRRQMGVFLIILSVAFFFLILSYTSDVLKLYGILHENCNLPANVCPYNTSMPSQSIVAFTLDGLLGASGLYLIFTEKYYKRTIKLQNEKIKAVIKGLDPDEKKIVSFLTESGAVFQSELVEKSGINKVKVTRILNRLEGRGLVERKRHGMSNMVVLKHRS